MISVVIPTLNAAQHLPSVFLSISRAAIDGLVTEVIVSDGGSSDETCSIAEHAGAKVLTSPQGRGRQLHNGAVSARKPWLLFLHADTRLQEGWEEDASSFIKNGGKECAAAFRFRLADSGFRPRSIEAFAAMRCRLMRLPYGDQGLLISRALYDKIGGFGDLPLMEDVDIVRRLGRRRISILKAAAITSAERYVREGYLKRSMRNLGCLGLYLAGVAPQRLLRFYG